MSFSPRDTLLPPLTASPRPHSSPKGRSMVNRGRRTERTTPPAAPPLSLHPGGAQRRAHWTSDTHVAITHIAPLVRARGVWEILFILSSCITILLLCAFRCASCCARTPSISLFSREKDATFMSAEIVPPSPHPGFPSPHPGFSVPLPGFSTPHPVSAISFSAAAAISFSSSILRTVTLPTVLRRAMPSSQIMPTKRATVVLPHRQRRARKEYDATNSPRSRLISRPALPHLTMPGTIRAKR